MFFSNTKPFIGGSDKEFKKGGIFFSGQKQVKQAVEKAEKSLLLTHEQRLSSLLAEFELSSDDSGDEAGNDEMEAKIDDYKVLHSKHFSFLCIHISNQI